MTAIAHEIVSPYTLKTATMTFQLLDATGTPTGDVDDFTDHIGSITFTPTAQSGSWTGASGNVVSENGVATWVAGFGLIQDLDAESLLMYLLEHEGVKAKFSGKLKSGTRTVSGIVTLTPATIGGDVGPNPLSSTVNMPMDGKPAFI